MHNAYSMCDGQIHSSFLKKKTPLKLTVAVMLTRFAAKVKMKGQWKESECAPNLQKQLAFQSFLVTRTFCWASLPLQGVLHTVQKHLGRPTSES